MGFYKIIKIKGPDGAYTGYFVKKMYKLPFVWNELKVVGLKFVKERLRGWTMWYVTNEADYENAVKRLDELRKTRLFEYKVLVRS